VALFDRPAFKRCLTHGIVLGDDGQKMSKRLRNYPDPEAMFEVHGADAMRWFLMSSPVLRGGNLITDEKGITDAVRSALLPLWNAWYFFALYANADGRTATLGRTNAPGTLDRYILAKLRQLVEDVTVELDSYDLSGACGAIEAFLDALTNWYIRRSRDRFWGTGAEGAATQDAFDTLGTVLEVLCRVTAPLMPLVTDAVWLGLTSVRANGDERSVHLEDWPEAKALPSDPDLVADMDWVREICSAAHSIRKANSLRARLPLAQLTVAAEGAEKLRGYADLIADEVNVREVELTEDTDRYATRTLNVAFPIAAPRLGKATQAAAAAAKRGDWELLDDGRARVGESLLDPGEFELRVRPLDEATTRTLAGNSGVVVLDTQLNEDLLDEGRARDLVRLVQQGRRDIALHVTDRIVLEISGDELVLRALDAHRAWIAEQILATEILLVETDAVASDDPSGAWASTTLADGSSVAVRIKRSAS
jgi:isoleucyl-tRNA synthetase